MGYYTSDETKRALEKIRGLAAKRDKAQADLDAAIGASRKRSGRYSWSSDPLCTWQEIGSVFGFSKQTAHRKFRHLEPEVKS